MKSGCKFICWVYDKFHRTAYATNETKPIEEYLKGSPLGCLDAKQDGETSDFIYSTSLTTIRMMAVGKCLNLFLAELARINFVGTLRSGYFSNQTLTANLKPFQFIDKLFEKEKS